MARLNARSQSVSAATIPPASSMPTWTIAFCAQPSECTSTPSGSRPIPRCRQPNRLRSAQEAGQTRSGRNRQLVSDRGEYPASSRRSACPGLSYSRPRTRCRHPFPARGESRRGRRPLRPAYPSARYRRGRSVPANPCRAQCLPARSGYPMVRPRPRHAPGTASSSARTSWPGRCRKPSDPRDRRGAALYFAISASRISIREPLNAGITSLANRSNCSRITASGTPNEGLIEIRSRPG